MSTPTQIRCKTGQRCPRSGVYRFDGYLDGTVPADSAAPREGHPLAERNVAPPIHSPSKGCHWLLIRLA